MHYLVGNMDYKIHYSWYPVVLEDIVTQTGYVMQMSYMPLVDMLSLLAVVLFNGGQANRPS